MVKQVRALQEKLESLKKVLAERRSDINTYKVRCMFMHVCPVKWPAR